MENILIHGLGQDELSWTYVNEKLKEKNIKVKIPNLFKQVNKDMNYEILYNSFVEYCKSCTGKLNLCGLSLGGILAIDYAIEYPNKVNSIVIIGTPYKIPKALFKVQNMIFKFMPKKTFNNMGISKKNFVRLVNSMSELEIFEKLKDIKCKTLVLCGEKDNTNMKSAKLLDRNIKNSELKIISNSGHEVNIDNPEELANIIYEFWKIDS